MRFNTLTTILIAALLVVSAGAATAAVQFDTEETNTATTSDITPSSYNVTYNESDDIYLEVEVETTTPAIEIVDPDANDTVAYQNGTDLDNTYSDTSTSPETHYYATNVSQSVFSDIEMDAGEEKRFEVTIINDETLDDPTTTTQNMTLINDGKRTFLVLEDSEVGEDGPGAAETQTFLGLEIPALSDDTAEIDDTVAINGSDTTATYAIDNTTVADRMDASTEGADEGDWVLSTVATVDDDPIHVYADAAPDDIDQNETFAVWNSDADELEVHFGDDFDGASSADVWVTSGAGWSTQISTYGAGTWASELVGMMTAPVGLLSAGSLVVVGGRRIGA